MNADGTAASSGWQKMGTWTVPPTVYIDRTGFPLNRSGEQLQISQTAYDDAGYQDLHSIWLWITPGINAPSANTCLIRYDYVSNTLNLATDSGTDWVSTPLDYSRNVLSNTQCSVPTEPAYGTDTRRSIVPTIKFTPAFSGTYEIWEYAEGGVGDSGWQKAGNFTLMMKYPGLFIGEGADQFLLPVQITGTIPLYRLLFNGQGPPIHHWTTDAYELSVLTAPGGGWTWEGTTGYLYPPSASAPSMLTAERAPEEGVSAIVSAVGYQPGAVAAGQRIRILGQFGGESVRVRIGGKDARVVGARGAEVEAVVPQGVDLGRTEIQVWGAVSSEAPLEIAAAAPAVMTRDLSGYGQASALNEDRTANDAGSPAESGSIVQLSITGDGGLPVTATIGGHPAEVVSVKANANEGVSEVAVRVPDVAAYGTHVPVRVKAGEFFSQAGVTIAVGAKSGTRRLGTEQ